MKKWILPALLGLASMAWGDQPHVAKAKAQIKSVAGMDVSGEVTFTEDNSGTTISGEIKGLKPGYHGFHVHEKGDCSAADFSSVGAHYNPTNKKHGGPNSAERHVGDLGNIEADASGIARFSILDKEIRLNGETSVVGRAIVVHSDADDFISQPAGNSGSKIGCGVIQEVK